MRIGVTLVLAAALTVPCACGSTKTTPAGPVKVTNFTLESKLMGRPMFEVLATPAGGGKGRALLVFLHGYGGSPSDTLSPTFLAALRHLGDKAPVVFLTEGAVGWWHDDANGRWGSYVLRDAIPAALAHSGADLHRVAIGGISMGGFGALDLARLAPHRFCAVGRHSAALWVSRWRHAAGRLRRRGRLRAKRRPRVRPLSLSVSGPGMDRRRDERSLPRRHGTRP